MMDIHERYRNDPYFKKLVDTIYIFIVEGNTTPTEVREAAMCTQIMYKERHLRPITLDAIDSIRRK